MEISRLQKITTRPSGKKYEYVGHTETEETVLRTSHRVYGFVAIARSNDGTRWINFHAKAPKVGASLLEGTARVERVLPVEVQP